MADKLAEAKLPVIVHPTMQRVARVGNLQQPSGQCRGAGRPRAADRHRQRLRRLRAQDARRAGTRRPWRWSTAWASTGRCKAITLDAAKSWTSTTASAGSKPAKSADLVLYDGDPFEHATHVTAVIVGGRLVYDRAEKLKRPVDERMMFFMNNPDVPCCLGW